MVVLEGRTVGVMSVAIGFDHEALGRPVEVNEKLSNQDIGLRQWQAELATKREEVDLHGRNRVDGTRVDFHRNPPQPADPSFSSPSPDHLLQMGPAYASALIARNQSALQLFGVEARSHVQQGSLRRGDRNPLLKRHVVIREHAGLV
jgi:hypothetical protein